MQIQSLGQEDPWIKKWQPTPVFLPVKFHGQRSLVEDSPWGCNDMDTAIVTWLTCIDIICYNISIYIIPIWLPGSCQKI